MNEHLTIADVLRYHDRKAREALDKSQDARCSSWTRVGYKQENELHSTLAAVIRRHEAKPLPCPVHSETLKSFLKAYPWVSVLDNKSLLECAAAWRMTT